MNPTEARSLAEEMLAESDNPLGPICDVLVPRAKIAALADAFLAALDENERLRKAAEKGDEGFWESLYKRAGV